MRGAIAALLLATLVSSAPPSAAQAPTGARPVGVQAAGAAAVQSLAAQAYYTSLLQLYGLQSAAAMTPAARAQAAQAMTEYLANGAQATGVPDTGPAAAYFTRGAEVSAVPTSAIPDYSFAPATPSLPRAPAADGGAPRAAVEAGAPNSATSSTPSPDGGADGAIAATALSTLAFVTKGGPPSAPTGRQFEPPTESATPSQSELDFAQSGPSGGSGGEPRAPASANPSPQVAQDFPRMGAAASMPSGEPASAASTSGLRTTPPSVILVPMAIGLALAGLLIAMGLRT